MATGKAPRGAIDWAALRRRLEAASRATSEAAERPPEEARALLEERARVLARPVVPSSHVHRLEAITFSLANERYAIESRYVIEVFRLRELAPLPGAKPPIFGLTAWRGALLTILDLRAALGLPVAALNDLGRVVVLGTDRPAFGVLADAVHEVVSLDASEVREPRGGASAARDYVRGITPDAVQVLEGERLLRLLEPGRN
jgi:purine-binding chemotaxis protein CheW